MRAPRYTWLLLGIFGANAFCGVRSVGQDALPHGDSTSEHLQHVAKPERKADQVVTEDPIALLAVRHDHDEMRSAETPTPRPSDPIANETARKAAEIALLEQQIRDKQKRITLLMRLFVEDEQKFLNDPGNPAVDAASAERRRYEQQELLWETAELARLKTKRAGFTAAR